MIKLKRLHCSFCGKNETEVSKLVAGPRVYICDECVAIASRMMENDSNNRGPQTKAERSFCRKVAACVRELLRAGRKRGANLARVSG